MLAGLVPSTHCRSSVRALHSAYAAALGCAVAVDEFLATLEAAGYLVDDDLMVAGLLTEDDFLAALELDRLERWHCRFCLDPHFERQADGRLLCTTCHPTKPEEIKTRIEWLAKLDRPQYVSANVHKRSHN